MLRNLKIGYRLSIGFGLLIIIFIVLAAFELYRMNLLSRQTTMMHDHPLTVSNAVLRINTNIIKFIAV
jgi:CHASE3 domain sensor protein